MNSTYKADGVNSTCTCSNLTGTLTYTNGGTVAAPTGNQCAASNLGGIIGGVIGGIVVIAIIVVVVVIMMGKKKVGAVAGKGTAVTTQQGTVLQTTTQIGK